MSITKHRDLMLICCFGLSTQNGKRVQNYANTPIKMRRSRDVDGCKQFLLMGDYVPLNPHKNKKK
jgi:hypothetical protein